MHFENDFGDKGCVITGAASGIGLAVAEALLRAGAVVTLADRDAKTLAAAVERLGSHGARVHSANIDVMDQRQVQRLIEDSASRLLPRLVPTRRKMPSQPLGKPMPTC